MELTLLLPEELRNPSEQALGTCRSEDLTPAHYQRSAKLTLVGSETRMSASVLGKLASPISQKGVCRV